MRILALGVLLAGVTSLPLAAVAAQDTTIARPGDLVRVMTATSTDSLLRGRFSWSSSDSLSVWGHGKAMTFSITALRSIDVRRRPGGFTKRTVVTSALLGLAGGAIGAHLGRCAHRGVPSGAIDLGCDTPDAGYASVLYAIVGAAIGTVTGGVVQAIREPARWVPARIATR